MASLNFCMKKKNKKQIELDCLNGSGQQNYAFKGEGGFDLRLCPGSHRISESSKAKIVLGLVKLPST